MGDKRVILIVALAVGSDKKAGIQMECAQEDVVERKAWEQDTGACIRVSVGEGLDAVSGNRTRNAEEDQKGCQGREGIADASSRCVACPTSSQRDSASASSVFVPTLRLYLAHMRVAPEPCKCCPETMSTEDRLKRNSPD